MASRPRNAPGTYCDVRDEHGDHDPGHYVYGHLTADEFRAAVNAHHGEEKIGPGVEVVHLYARSVFASWPVDEGDREWITSVTASRGAAKVTAVRRG